MMDGTGFGNKRRALLLIDHGSRMAAANQNLEDVAALLRRRGAFPIVVAAHMELEQPSIEEGVRLCLAAGAGEIVALPYFLAAGRHSTMDIRRLVAEAVPPGCAVRVAVAEPLGLHKGLLDAALQRADEALKGCAEPAIRPAARLRREECVLLVVDLQERLIPKIFNSETLIASSRYLLECFKILGVPVLATEQYPAGLGPTAPAIAQSLPEGTSILEKTAFSGLGSMDVRAALPKDRNALLLCGIETHVCVMQTALDAMEAGWRVAIIVDAVGARRAADHEAALARLRDAGAVAVTAEMVVFELLREAGTAEFKALRPLLKAGPGPK